MKLLIKSSKALKMLAGTDGSTRLVEEPFATAGGGVARWDKDGDGKSASGREAGFLTVLGVSSASTEHIAVETAVLDLEIGVERRRFPPERKGEEMASIVGNNDSERSEDGVPEEDATLSDALIKDGPRR